jgi:AP endonuclease-1
MASKASAKFNKKDSKWLGAHLSIAGKLSFVNPLVSLSPAADAASFFLRSRTYASPKPISSDVNQFFNRLLNESNGKDIFWKSRDMNLSSTIKRQAIVPHSQYIVNCASANSETRDKSIKCLIEDLERCDQLGIKLYNMHPGSTPYNLNSKQGREAESDAIKRISNAINQAHLETRGVTILLENMAGQKNAIGNTFDQLKRIIEYVKDKSRIGVCFDTCHAFAAGYDLRNEYDQVFQKFEDSVGMRYLKAMHLNDSKYDLGCHRDRHESIGRGKLGLEFFRKLMNDNRFNHLPMILETPVDLTKQDPHEKYTEEIELLKSLIE